MQYTVILTLATMLAIVAAVFVFLLWRAYRRSALREWLQAAGRQGRVRPSSLPDSPAGAPPSHSPAAAALSSGDNDSPGHSLRAAASSAGIATAALLHH